jgi:hypothetical protein
MPIFKILIFGVLIITSASFAQTTHTHGAWLGVFGKSTITENRIYLWQEFQLRHNLENHFTNQSLFRFGPLLKLNDTQEIGLLYAHTQTHPRLAEHRLTQQYIHRWTKKFLTRFRLEERISETDQSINLRTRVLLRHEHPVFENFNIVAWNEIFFHLTNPDWVQSTLTDRNRFFVGFKKSFSPYPSYEVGYMNQWTELSNRAVSEHLLVIYLNY